MNSPDDDFDDVTVLRADECTPVEIVLPGHTMPVQLAFCIARHAVDEQLADLSPADVLAVAGLLRGHLDRVEDLERIARRAAGGRGAL